MIHTNISPEQLKAARLIMMLTTDLQFDYYMRNIASSNVKRRSERAQRACCRMWLRSVKEKAK